MSGFRYRFVAVAMVTFGLVAFASTPAEAANKTRGCITKREFRKVPMGSTLAQARAFIGAHGRISESQINKDGSGWISVRFRRCGEPWDNSWVYLGFNPSRYQESDGAGGTRTVFGQPYILSGKHAIWD